MITLASKASVNLRLRSLSLEDTETVAMIEKKIRGIYRPSFWEQKIDHYMTNPEACVGAELDNDLVAFMMGHLKGGGEFGSNDGTAWLEIMGVDPKYQNLGIGRTLFDYFRSYFHRIGVKKVHVLVRWDDVQNISFFSNVGFQESQYISLEIDV